MNSCLYECDIMHCRIKPKRYKFTHKVFMFYIDLDEIDELSNKLRLLGHNKTSVYNFRDSDHLELGRKTTKENILLYLKSKGVDLKGGRVMLLTNLRTMGHIFNPVSFYFCFDKDNNPVCVVVEIGNTFGELKPYFIGPESLDSGRFRDQQTKYFYISPFVDLDIPMDFRLKIPSEKLDIHIDDFKDREKFIYTSMLGTKKELNNKNLLWYGICFPFITLKVIGLIHLHAGILHYIKRIPYHKKANNPHLQREVHRVYSKN